MLATALNFNPGVWTTPISRPSKVTALTCTTDPCGVCFVIRHVAVGECIHNIILRWTGSSFPTFELEQCALRSPHQLSFHYSQVQTGGDLGTSHHGYGKDGSRCHQKAADRPVFFSRNAYTKRAASHPAFPQERWVLSKDLARKVSFSCLLRCPELPLCQWPQTSQVES